MLYTYRNADCYFHHIHWSGNTFPCLEPGTKESKRYRLHQYYSKSLLAAGYINEHNYSFLICPDWEPRKELGDHHQMYGMRQTQELTYSFVKIDNPSTHVLLADSIRLDPTDTKDGMKQYFIFYGTVGQYKNRVHCRHSRKANVGFMDGHVKPCSGEELQKLQCPKYCYCPNPCSEHAAL